MNAHTAETLIASYNTASKELHDFFRPLIKDYIDFMKSRDTAYNSWGNFIVDVDDYLFYERSGNSYYFDIPYDEDGDSTIALPYEFVEDSELFKKRALQQDAILREASEARQKKNIEDKRNALFLELARIQRELTELD